MKHYTKLLHLLAGDPRTPVTQRERRVLLELAQELEMQEAANQVNSAKAKQAASPCIEFDDERVTALEAAVSDACMKPQSVEGLMEVLESRTVSKTDCVELAKRVTRRSTAYRSKRDAIDAIRARLIERYRDAVRTAALSN